MVRSGRKVVQPVLVSGRASFGKKTGPAQPVQITGPPRADCAGLSVSAARWAVEEVSVRPGEATHDQPALRSLLL